jgi:hypothetical protein
LADSSRFGGIAVSDETKERNPAAAGSVIDSRENPSRIRRRFGSKTVVFGLDIIDAVGREIQFERRWMPNIIYSDSEISLFTN